MEDKQIVALYCNREEQAIEKTAEKYGKYCFSIADNILHNAEDSEECVNDTWMKAWTTIPPTIPTYLRVFLGKITRNLSFDKYRASHSAKRGGGEVPLILDELEEVLMGNGSVEVEYERKELVESINTFLYSLSEKDSNIFVRRYFFAETTEEIAKRYDLKESNVRVILSRIRKKLQTHLIEEELV